MSTVPTRRDCTRKAAARGTLQYDAGYCTGMSSEFAVNSEMDRSKSCLRVAN